MAPGLPKYLSKMRIDAYSDSNIGGTVVGNASFFAFFYLLSTYTSRELLA
jgi:hypothetical protein